MKTKKRWLSMAFALIMAVSLIPFGMLTAFAEGDDVPEHTVPITEKPVYVTVKDDSGNPISGATVQVLDADGNVVETVTNADETFTVFLPAGTYTLMVTKAPSGYIPAAEIATITVELTEAEEKDDIEADTFPSTVEAHKLFCKHNPSHLEAYVIYDEGEEITGFCFNQNYDPPTRTPTEAQGDCKYKRLVGTPELLYQLAQCKWLGPDGNGFTPQELYDHVVSMIYHRKDIQEKYGFDDLFTDYLTNMAIKQFTDGSMRSFQTTDEDGKNLVVREYYPNGPVVYDENGYYQFNPGGSVLGSIVGHANGASSSDPNYVFPQAVKDAFHEMLTLTDHPDDYYLYIYYPHNFMTKEEGVASGWNVPAHYDPEWYYYADAFQCLLSTFTVEPVRTELKVLQTTEIEITKTWADENDQDGLRPSADVYTRMVKLYADGKDVTDTYANFRTVTDNGDNTYTVKFTDLKKLNEGTEIEYKIKEIEVEGYKPDKIEVAGGGVITNTHTPEPTEITVTKEWQDGENADGVRPEKITVHLLADGTEIDSAEVKPDDSGKWSYTFKDLPKYKDHGKEIVYTITEDPVPEYESVIDTYKITNKHTPETTEISIQKEWRDGDDKDELRPESITVRLYADGKEVDSAEVKPDEDGNWKYTFTDLPKNRDGGVAIKYTVTEDPVPEYDDPQVVQDSSGNWIILNIHTPGVVKVPVEKVWDDSDDADRVRPDSITVRLYADGEEIDSAEIEPDENGDWAYTFENLPMYKDGKKIAYTVSEDPVPEYEATVDGYKITNKHTSDKTDITVEKVWDDANNADGKRPESIKVHLFADGEEIDSAEIKPDENGYWKHTFTDLPKYKDGEEIVYTVTEDPVPEYETTVDGLKITNKHVPEKIELNGKKTWDDNDDKEKLRPTSITIRLFADGKEVASKTVTKADGWKWSFTVDKYKDGKEIKYTIKEDRVRGYVATVKGLDVINTYSPPTGDEDHPQIWIALLAISLILGLALLVVERLYSKRA